MRWHGFLFLLFSLTVGLALSFGNGARASINDNVRGLADSLHGYISFNCLDDDFAGHFVFTFPFRFNVPPCSFSQHGVNLNLSNNFSGLAWNPSLGFIEFGATSTPPDNYASTNANCLNQCNAGNSCSACYNEVDQRVYGWAQIVSTGEWIELNSTVAPPTTMTNSAMPQPGIFSGYASSSFGAISFNCSNNGSCGTFDHKVYLWKLEIEDMSAPNWSFNEACTSGARRAVFKWSRRSGTQTAYRVIINTTNSTSSHIFDSGILPGDALQLTCPGPLCGFNPAYNTSYYWWLQLWNEAGESTEFFQFDTNIYGDGSLTDNEDYNKAVNPDDYNLTFTTYRHEFPTPYFTWSPFEITVSSTTDFVSNSHYYSSAFPDSNAQNCVDGTCQFLWQVSDGAAIIANATRSTTSIIFINKNPKTVSLRITDPDLYICSTSSPVLTINFNLPIWKEVKAE